MSVEICNLALSHLGIGKEIADLDAETSEEAAACRRFYTLTIRKALIDFPWPFASRFATLALVEEDPTDEWAYSYRYPANCMKLRRILSGARQDTLGSRVPYKIGADDAGKLIYTDMEEAEVEYTVEPADEGIFDELFKEAVSYYLAAQMAPRLTAGDPFKLGEQALKMYQFTMARAQANAIREQQPDFPLEAESIRARS